MNRVCVPLYPCISACATRRDGGGRRGGASGCRRLCSVAIQTYTTAPAPQARRPTPIEPKNSNLAFCTPQDALGAGASSSSNNSSGGAPVEAPISERVRQRAAARRREQLTYQASAIAASLGVGALAVGATYYRFSMHMSDGAPFPW
jgi:hypothetical protein